jgi:DMSO/TMAO reductase YedYZ molybdopterin-dependent catalytic subunit
MSEQQADTEQVVASGTDAEMEARIRRLSRRSFLWAGLATGAGVGGLVAFNKYAPENNGAKTPLRKALAFNEAVAQRLFYRSTHLSKEFPRAMAQEPRNNYKGDTPYVDLDAWNLKLSGLEGGAS